MKTFNCYLIGVGGQGIGLLAETILRAVDHAGIPVKSVDTHGLAQRGGTVISQIRMGDQVFSPIIPPFGSDLILSLELHEAYRALMSVSKPASTLICYDAFWQPLSVRKGVDKAISAKDLLEAGGKKEVKVIMVKEEKLHDSRMQNIALLKVVCTENLIPGVTQEHYLKAMEDLMKGKTLEANRGLFLA
jgi:indolepyruvate ferredoxin oxidoreductase, beta subunit